MCSALGFPIDMDQVGGNSRTFITAATASALRLTELPCADSFHALSLQKIHTAVCMLLDAMHDVEGHLGRGATVARTMAVALLLKSGKCPEGNSSGLEHCSSGVRHSSAPTWASNTGATAKELRVRGRRESIFEMGERQRSKRVRYGALAQHDR